MEAHQAWQDIYHTAKAWTQEAGQRLRDTLGGTLNVEYKTSAADLVTQKDHEIEEFFIEHIRHHYPEHAILGEEGLAETIEDPYREIVWVIDPIDGTTNFVHQQANFCISVGIYEQGEPRIGIIYDPIHDEFFHTLKGQGAYFNERKLEPLEKTTMEQSVLGINGLWLTPNRRYDHRKLQSIVRHARGSRSLGSAALELAYVACGRLDGYLTLRLSPWDYAAGLVILNELGARMTTIENEPIDIFTSEQTSIFVAKPGLHEHISDHFLLVDEAPGW
ncbi:inositol monophosphatase family protein [Caldalkalibacillus salinus]|uniref:inositol monophosphatase family protein n=1 Tax=Caldalkalibacillus salinus TaxID=2803787 RepID=UPI0019213214|nr:inositol monophosphatase family protein [Caldalkalibacillus salinus]